MEYGASGKMACGLLIRMLPEESCPGQVNEKEMESQVATGAAFRNGVRSRRMNGNGSIVQMEEMNGSTCPGGDEKEGEKAEKGKKAREDQKKLENLGPGHYYKNIMHGHGDDEGVAVDPNLEPSYEYNTHIVNV
jgi:hypothetical protein